MVKNNRVINIALSGASGKMGLVLQTLIKQAPDKYQLVALLSRDKECRDKEERDEKPAMPDLPAMYKELGSISDEIDVVIDFSRPEFSLKLLAQAAEKRVAFVSGTTGFSEQQLAQIENLAKNCPVLIAANMSVGINLAVELVKLSSLVLGSEAKVSISETHHIHKIDAPSGTALALGDAVAGMRKQQLNEVMQYEENSIIAADQAHKIDFSVKREGEVIGDHAVIFEMDSETLSIQHHAKDRTVFARGALHAASWLYCQNPGRYHMSDVLELGKKLAGIT